VLSVIGLDAGVAAAAEPHKNPDLPLRCGLDIVLVLDASSSLRQDGQHYYRDVRDASAASLNAFQATNTRIAMTYYDRTDNNSNGTALGDVGLDRHGAPLVYGQASDRASLGFTDIDATTNREAVTYRSGDLNEDQLLDLDETWSFTCSQHLVQDTTNTAVVTGVDRLGMEVSDQDTAFVAVIDPSIDIVKTVDKPFIHSGDSVVYSYEVTNTGVGSLASVEVVDDKCSPVSFVAGDADQDGLLDENYGLLSARRIRCGGPILPSRAL